MRINGVYHIIYDSKCHSTETRFTRGGRHPRYENYSPRRMGRGGLVVLKPLCVMFYSIQYQAIHAHEAKENRTVLPKSSH